MGRRDRKMSRGIPSRKWEVNIKEIISVKLDGWA